MARDGNLDRLRMQILSIEDDWLLEDEVQFPSRLFVVRGPKASRIYSWSDRLSAKWNDRDLSAEDFIKEERAFNQISLDTEFHAPYHLNSYELK